MQTCTETPAYRFAGFDPFKLTKLERLNNCGKFGRPWLCKNKHRRYHTMYCGSPFCGHCARQRAAEEIPKLCSKWQQFGTHAKLFEFLVQPGTDLNEAIGWAEEEASGEIETPLAMATFVAGIQNDRKIVIKVLVLDDGPGNNLEKLVRQLFEPVIPTDPKVLIESLDVYPSGFRRIRKKLFVRAEETTTNNFPEDDDPTRKDCGPKPVLCPCCGERMRPGPIMPIEDLPAHMFPPSRHRIYDPGEDRYPQNEAN